MAATLWGYVIRNCFNKANPTGEEFPFLVGMKLWRNSILPLWG
jgi:hypothetical protein